jgi:glycosyltransferase involved in cell wall biosynthesis
MDIMVLTSISEGLPTVLLEAMAMGKPVITSDAGGSPEIVTHGVTGFIFRSTDLDGFVAAMDSLVSDSALTGQMAAAAHDDIHRHYTLERMVSRYAELFRDIAMGGY